MPARRRPPSRQRYADAHPTIGVHVDRPTYEKLVNLREESGRSFSYLVKRALGVVEKEVTTAITRGVNKGRHAGHAEGRRAGILEGRKSGHEEGWAEGHKAGWDTGHAEGRRFGYAEAASRYRIEYRCARCRRAIAVESDAPDGRAAIATIEARGWRHAFCPPLR